MPKLDSHPDALGSWAQAHCTLPGVSTEGGRLNGRWLSSPFYVSPVYENMRQGLLWDVPVVCEVCEDRIHKKKMEEHMWPAINSVLICVLWPYPWSHSHIGSVNNMILHSEAMLSCSGWEGGMQGYCRPPSCPFCGFVSLWRGTLVQEVASAMGTLSISRWFYHG